MDFFSQNLFAKLLSREITPTDMHPTPRQACHLTTVLLTFYVIFLNQCGQFFRKDNGLF